jgi:hypothetical protein
MDYLNEQFEFEVAAKRCCDKTLKGEGGRIAVLHMLKWGHSLLFSRLSIV